jgi:hypothetical protein
METDPQVEPVSPAAELGDSGVRAGRPVKTRATTLRARRTCPPSVPSLGRSREPLLTRLSVRNGVGPGARLLLLDVQDPVDGLLGLGQGLFGEAGELGGVEPTHCRSSAGGGGGGGGGGKAEGLRPGGRAARLPRPASPLGGPCQRGAMTRSLPRAEMGPSALPAPLRRRADPRAHALASSTYTTTRSGSPEFRGDGRTGAGTWRHIREAELPLVTEQRRFSFYGQGSWSTAGVLRPWETKAARRAPSLRKDSFPEITSFAKSYRRTCSNCKKGRFGPHIS